MKNEDTLALILAEGEGYRVEFKEKIIKKSGVGKATVYQLQQ